MASSVSQLSAGDAVGCLGSSLRDWLGFRFFYVAFLSGWVSTSLSGNVSVSVTLNKGSACVSWLGGVWVEATARLFAFFSILFSTSIKKKEWNIIVTAMITIYCEVCVCNSRKELCSTFSSRKSLFNRTFSRDKVAWILNTFYEKNIDVAPTKKLRFKTVQVSTDNQLPVSIKVPIHIFCIGVKSTAHIFGLCLSTEMRRRGAGRPQVPAITNAHRLVSDFS